MALKKPKFGSVNLKANQDMTKSASVFVDIKPDSKIRVRFLPPWSDAGTLFFAAFNHYRYKDEGQKRAWGCLTRHGNPEVHGKCAACEFSDALKANGATKKAGREIEARGRWYAQVIVEGLEDEGPKLIALSKTTADQVTEILTLQANDDEPFLCDEEEGIWIQIKREGAGLDTVYTVLPTAKIVPLSKLCPDWESKAFDVVEAVGLHIGTRQDQLRSIVETHRTKYADVYNEVFDQAELMEATTD